MSSWGNETSKDGFPVIDGVEIYRLPPEGYQLDFADPHQICVTAHYVCFGLGIFFATIAILQRLYTKIFLCGGFQIDDLFMTLSWAGSVSMQSILIWQVAVKALGAHVYEIPLSRFETYSKVTYAATPLFTFVANFAKLSLAMFYFKLSPQRWFRNACWATVIGTFINWLVLTMLALFKCKHVRDGYDVRHRAIADHSQCIDAAKQYIATSATNILIDVVLFLLPIPMIVKLRLSKQQKAGAILIFAIGSMTVATSIVRAAYVSQILQTKDPPWDGANGSVWSIVEANLFIVCGSIPTLRKFFKHFAPRLMGTNSSTNGSNHSRHVGTSIRPTVGSQRSALDDLFDDEIEELPSIGGQDPNRALEIVTTDLKSPDTQVRELESSDVKCVDLKP